MKQHPGGSAGGTAALRAAQTGRGLPTGVALSIKPCLQSRAAGSTEDNFQSLPGFPQAVFKRASCDAQGGSDTRTS